ncbi:hypothetical protein HXA35_01590 [Bacillus sp. A301a_S52]|nr:hypothetical protein [Bacillus sp. A301a_S52]
MRFNEGKFFGVIVSVILMLVVVVGCSSNENAEGNLNNSSAEADSEVVNNSETELLEKDLFEEDGSDLLQINHEQHMEMVDRGFDIREAEYFDDQVVLLRSNNQTVGINWRDGSPILSENSSVSHNMSETIVHNDFYYFKDYHNGESEKVSILSDGDYDVHSVDDDEFEYVTSTFADTYRYVFEDKDGDDDESLLVVKAYDDEELVWESEVPGRDWHMNNFRELEDYVFLYVNADVQTFILDKTTGEVVFHESMAYFQDAYQVGNSIYLITNFDSGSDYQLYEVDTESWENELVLELHDLRDSDEAHFIYEGNTLAVVLERNILGFDTETNSLKYNYYYGIEGSIIDQFNGDFEWLENDGLLYALADLEHDYGFSIIDIDSGELLSQYKLEGEEEYLSAYLVDVGEDHFVINSDDGVFEFRFDDFE